MERWSGHARIGRTASTALPQRKQVYARFIDFQKVYDSVWRNGMFLSLVLKSIALSYTPDSRHILEIAMCSKK